MAKSIQQAEAELRAAALKAVALDKAYQAACDAERDLPGTTYPDGDYKTYSPEWNEACRTANAARDDMFDAAKELSQAIANEQRAEAL